MEEKKEVRASHGQFGSLLKTEILQKKKKEKTFSEFTKEKSETTDFLWHWNGEQDKNETKKCGTEVEQVPRTANHEEDVEKTRKVNRMQGLTETNNF